MDQSQKKDWKQRQVPIEKVLEMLKQHLGASSEVVFHDLTKPYDHTIVDIHNGEITGRTLGGCGSNLGLEVIRGVVKNGDRFNYITHTKSGRILRSSTIYLYDDDQVVGALCVNTDISDTVRIENMLRQYNGYSFQSPQPAVESEEYFAHNVSELMEHFMQEAQRLVGVPAPLMNREEKIRFLRYLDSKGAFLISKSSEHACAFLGISKYTLYNCLEEIRSGLPQDIQK